MADPADAIRKRIQELKQSGEGLFTAEQAASTLGPEAVEIEFADRFKRQMVERQARLDREREAPLRAAESRRQSAEAERVALADPKNIMAELAPQPPLSIPGLEDAGRSPAVPDDGSLILPGVPAAPAEPAEPRNRYPRRAQFFPPNPARDMAERRATQAMGAASAAAAVPPVAQAARERQRAREAAAAPGGLNVSPERVEADRAAASQAAAAPAPARSGKAELSERTDRARESKEIEQYRLAMSRHDAAMQVWRTQLDQAFEAGDTVRASQLAENEPQPPEPPPSVTGGLAGNEVRAAWDHDNDPATPRIAETAAQTLARLKGQNPEAYEALRKTGIAAVGTDPAKLGAWISDQFGEMEPGERLEAMSLGGSRLADSRPALAVPSGSRGGLGEAGRQSSGPRSYDQSAIDPRTGKPIVIRDPANNARQETVPGAGDLPTPSGMRLRAPQGQDALESLGVGDLAAFPVNPPRMTPEWRQQMLGIGMMAFGLDRNQFAEGPQGDDLFIAATQKLLSKHQDKVAAGFETTPVVTGGFVYQPGQELRDRSNARAQQSEAERVKRTRRSGAAAIDPATGVPLGELLDTAAASGDAAKVRELTAQIRAADEAARTQTLADAKSKEADQRNRTNPARAPGMFRDSLAAAGNNPAAIAAVYRDWGMPDEADRILARDNQRFAINTQGQIGVANAAAAREPNGLEIMRMSDAQIVGGLLDEDPTVTMAPETAIDEYARVHGADGKPLTRDAAELGVARLLIQSRRPQALRHPVVQGALDRLFAPIWQRLPGARPDERTDGQWMDTKREYFQRQALDQLRLDPEAAGREFDLRKAEYDRRTKPAPAPAAG